MRSQKRYLDDPDKYQELLNVLHKVNPQLAEIVSKKYEEDRENFLEYARQAAESAPSYWAKASCPDCRGKGVIKRANQDTLSTCFCAERRYLKHLRKLRIEYNKNRRNTNA